MSETGIATKKDTLPGLLAMCIADNASDAIVLVDKLCRITYVNQQAEQILSLHSSAALRHPFKDLFSDSALASFNHAFDNAMQHGKMDQLEIPLGSDQIWLSMKVLKVDDESLCILFNECSATRRKDIVADSQQQSLSLALSGKGQHEILLPLVQGLEKTSATHHVCCHQSDR